MHFYVALVNKIKREHCLIYQIEVNI